MPSVGQSHTREEFIQAAARQGVRYQAGPFAIQLSTPVAEAAGLVYDTYGAHPVHPLGDVADFHVELVPAGGIRRFLRPQVRFLADGLQPFDPFPRHSAFPFLEWGINWCIATHAQQYLILHAAVVEKAGRALILAGEPGSGKSTLAAALMLRGWRLLSDEFGLVRPGSVALTAVPRAIALKNASIEAIQAFSPEADIGPEFANTRKGRVAHCRVSPAQAAGAGPVPAVACVFPRFTPGAGISLTPLARTAAFLKLANNSFNYQAMGQMGFDAVREIVSGATAHSLIYSQLDAAVPVLSGLVLDAGI